MAIGARPPLIAYNVNLVSDDLELARRIAREVRERDGGLPKVKAIGLALEQGVQVSMNLTDYRVTGSWTPTRPCEIGPRRPEWRWPRARSSAFSLWMRWWASAAQPSTPMPSATVRCSRHACWTATWRAPESLSGAASGDARPLKEPSPDR